MFPDHGNPKKRERQYFVVIYLNMAPLNAKNFTKYLCTHTIRQTDNKNLVKSLSDARKSHKISAYLSVRAHF